MKKYIAMLALTLFALSYMIVWRFGNKLTLYYDVPDMENISVDYGIGRVDCKYEVEDGRLRLDFKAVNAGQVTVTVSGKTLNRDGKYEPEEFSFRLYVHLSGVITVGSYLGRCRGDISFVISFYIIMALVLVYFIGRYRVNSKEKAYSYENTALLGMIIFIGTQLAYHLVIFVLDLKKGQNLTVFSLIRAIHTNIYNMIWLTLPVALILILLVIISNLKLMKMEGKSLKNMLGILLGGLIIIFIFMGEVVWLVAFRETMSKRMILIINFFFYSSYAFVSYLECVLLGTCISGYKASKRIPAFDKDYIIILGCGIRKDGTLPNLLKARVDRAVEFAGMQMHATGKDIVFVPSGGQGPDEIMPEAEAVKNYLLSRGIREDKILVEDKSENTYENIKFSSQLIENVKKDAKVAFSTTNYHVFRAGVIADEQNLEIEGIGAKTRTYYWINAFIREFVATLVSEKKIHIKTLLALALMMFGTTVMLILSFGL